MNRLKLISDKDWRSPFFYQVKRHWFICLSSLNRQFSPKIPKRTLSITIVTSKTEPAYAREASFVLTKGYPYVEADNNAGILLTFGAIVYLREQYEQGMRFAWLEYES